MAQMLVDFAQIQMETGSAATTFEKRPWRRT